MSGRRSLRAHRLGRRQVFFPGLYQKKTDLIPQAPVIKGSSYGHRQLHDFEGYQKSASQEPVRIDLHQIREAIDLLSLSQRLSLKEASRQPNLKQALYILQQAAARLYSTEHYQTLVIDYLKTKDVYTLTPGTVGQFLFGNTRPYYGMTTAECSPVGIGALPRKLTEGTDTKPALCLRQVWYYQDDKYRKLTTKNQEGPIEADVYVSLDFKGLTKNQLNRLAKSQVQKVTIYTLVKMNNSDEQVAIRLTPTLSLAEAELGRVKNHFRPEVEKLFFNQGLNSPQATTQSISSSNKDLTHPKILSPLPATQQWIWIILVIIFLILVIGLGYNLLK